MSDSSLEAGNVVSFRRAGKAIGVEIFGGASGGPIWVESLMEGGERRVIYSGPSYDEARMIAASMGVPITDTTGRFVGATGGDVA